MLSYSLCLLLNCYLYSSWVLACCNWKARQLEFLHVCACKAPPDPPFEGIFKARSEGLQGSLKRIPALLFKHKAMEGTTRKVKMFDRKSWTSSSSLAWVLLPTALGSVVEEEDYCAVPPFAVLQGCPVMLGKGAQSLLS